MPITVTRLQSISIILITSLFFAGLPLIHYKRAVIVMFGMNRTRTLMIKKFFIFSPSMSPGNVPIFQLVSPNKVKVASQTASTLPRKKVNF